MQKVRGQFSLEIIHCDGFTSMPATAQALYLQILASCDDEGFTSQIGMCKFLSHSSDDDLKQLVEKEFIFQIGNVTVVKHWWMNNYIREDRIEPSSFSERSQVYIKANGNYTLNDSEGSPLPPPKKTSKSVKGRPYVSQMSAKSQQSRTAPCVAPPTAPHAAPCVAPCAAEQDNTLQDNTDTPIVVSTIQANTLQDTPLDDGDDELPI